MASAVFSKLRSVSTKPLHRVSALATKARAKVGPHLPRSSTVVAGIKVSFAVATTLAPSVPYMQGIVDAASKVKEHADAMKSNRKECKKIAALTEDLARGVLAATDDVNEEELDDPTRLNLALFEWKLQTIGEAMGQMRKENSFRRFFAKDEHAETLAEHRQTLQDAVSTFQVSPHSQDVGVRILIGQDLVLHAVGSPSRRLPTLSVARRPRSRWRDEPVIWTARRDCKGTVNRSPSTPVPVTDDAI
ncbi:hypothetical protein BD310DRAFT_822055 [Dichomitus squalens]|uniref:Uncharacterized protein n=1 Tax=Dichomitus squalens TaxID=114155 RepID=A0A4Q9PS01_9APHY|nr:hypothetical protein BD310DRAFT_822055 [Dichomitus squalens]